MLVYTSYCAGRRRAGRTPSAQSGLGSHPPGYSPLFLLDSPHRHALVSLRELRNGSFCQSDIHVSCNRTQAHAGDRRTNPYDLHQKLWAPTACGIRTQKRPTDRWQQGRGEFSTGAPHFLDRHPSERYETNAGTGLRAGRAVVTRESGGIARGKGGSKGGRCAVSVEDVR
jgi:hypothetical protein